MRGLWGHQQAWFFPSYSIHFFLTHNPEILEVDRCRISSCITEYWTYSALSFGLATHWNQDPSINLGFMEENMTNIFTCNQKRCLVGGVCFPFLLFCIVWDNEKLPDFSVCLYGFMFFISWKRFWSLEWMCVFFLVN